MNEYQDKWSRWHDKPCLNGEPKSNNGWIYTAYGKYLDPNHLESRDMMSRLDCYIGCKKNQSPIKIDRLPGKLTPPLSKDEVIGLVSLGLLTRHELEDSHWNFCNFVEYQPKKLNFLSVCKAAILLYKARNEHRNYIWQNKVESAYSLAFWLAPHDQYYVIKRYGNKATILQTIAFYLNIVSVWRSDNKSTKMMLWLQLTDLNHWLAKKVPRDKWVRNYFVENHPFVKGLE